MVAARPAEGGLFVPGRPERAACDLLLHPDGVRLSAAELDVHLPYEAYAAPGGDSWTVGSWSSTRGGNGIGVGVHGAGRFAAPIADLRRRRRTLANLVDRLADRTNVAPLYAARTINTRADADRDALEVLLSTLAREPEWRRQLGDPTCVTRLLHDLATQDHASIAHQTGFRRRDMETSIVMGRLGLEHPLRGRPLPGDARPDVDDVVNAVLGGLAANKYAAPVDEASVRAFVHRHYLDVTSWPFAALLPDPPAAY
jgi:hypothetical protein